jgi:hypothetical protein
LFLNVARVLKTLAVPPTENHATKNHVKNGNLANKQLKTQSNVPGFLKMAHGQWKLVIKYYTTWHSFVQRQSKPTGCAYHPSVKAFMQAPSM